MKTPTKLISKLPKNPIMIPAGWHTKECAHTECTVVFTGTRSAVRSQRYCSRACSSSCPSKIQRNVASFQAGLRRLHLERTGEEWTPAESTLKHRAHQAKYPDRVAARRVSLRLREKMAVPTECKRCHGGGKIQGHHWSYAPEHAADVEYLCIPCHKKADPIRHAAVKAGFSDREIITMKWDIAAMITDGEIVAETAR